MTDWERPRPTVVEYRRDALAAAALAVGIAVSALLYARLGYYDDPAPTWLSALVLAGNVVPLVWRRRYPLPVAIVVSIAFFATQQFSVPEGLFVNITLFVGIYSLGAWGRDRRIATIARVVITIGMFVWIAVNLAVSVNNHDLLPHVSRAGVFSQFASFAVIQVLTNALYFGAAFYFGNNAWRAAHERAELEARTAELSAERSRTAAQAVALDRVRIARELHDVVAHHVSVMGVQAGAARRVIDADPAAASASLEAVEQSAREAVDEMHRLLTTLRSPGEESTVPNASSSTRGLDQIAELVAESLASGVATKMQVVGSSRPVTPLVGFTAYRVTQEALTNVRKHAGPGATAEVRLRFLESAIELEVTDTGIGRRPNRDDGLGILGMRERVAAAGGALEVGPRSRGGFLVRATVPA